MTRYFKIIILACLLPVILPLTPVIAADEDSTSELLQKDKPIEISADFLSFDQETGTYHAKGNVVIVQDSTTLYTDEAILDTDAGVATAKGGVMLIDEGGNVVKGTDLQVDIKKKTAILASGRLFYKLENVHITGSPIEKTGPESYRGEHMTFTTCDCPEGEKPSWHFSASSARVTVGDFMTARNVFFNVKGVPIFYTPFARIPVKRKRQTGILAPHPGYSKLRGFKLDNSFFWAISPHQDATFYLDLETSRGLGGGAEYRYYRTRRSYGEAFSYYFRERDINRVREFREGLENLARPESAGNDRWQFRWDHVELLGRGMNFKAKINVVSDDEYFIDFGDVGTERSLESLESNLSFSKNWTSTSLVAQFRRFDNLLNENDDDTLQKYPEVTLTGIDRKIPFTPLYSSYFASYIYFYRKAGVRGHRLDIKPRLSMPLNPGGYIEFRPSVGPRATFYQLDEDPTGRYLDRYIYDVKADLTTTFVRIFRPRFERLKALRHIIRPKLSYTFIPESVQDNLPSFDINDRVPATNTITYSINSLLTGKFHGSNDENPSYLDYLYLELSQSYDINEARRELVSVTDERQPFSDLRGELKIKPVSWAMITSKGLYDVYDSWFNSYDASLFAADTRGDKLDLSYRFVRDGESYFEAFGRVRLTNLLDITYSKRFSFEEERSLETSYGITYRSQCWAAILTYTKRLEENIILLTFDLKGLGKVAGIEGKIEQF